jgi:hypothetical protein
VPTSAAARCKGCGSPRQYRPVLASYRRECRQRVRQPAPRLCLHL